MSLKSNKKTVCAALMAGGAGTRLWPESRKNRPKPFLPLLPDGRSTLAAAFARLDGFVSLERRFVVAGKPFATLVRATLPTLAPNRLLLEPTGRDTAPCVAWAALEATKIDPDATLVVLPSDAWIAPDDLFRETLENAVRLVDAVPTRLVALGVPPTRPSSAYGYVEFGAKINVEVARSVSTRRDASQMGDLRCADAFCVESFREKPDVETARTYLATGRYCWNAGIFVWKARRILELIRQFEPELGATFDRIAALDAATPNGSLAETPDFIREFSSAKRISIDYAVLERAPDVVVLKAPFFWDDLGSFAALERVAESAKNDVQPESNLVVGADFIAENAARNFVRVLSTRSDNSASLSEPGLLNEGPLNDATRRKLIALVDVDDLIVVETNDALLVAKKGNETALRRLIERLKNEGRDAYL